jgi:hypothetical protein
MKTIKVLIGLYVSLGFIVFGYIYIDIGKVNLPYNADVVSSISDVFTAAAAVLNILLIINFYKRDRLRREKDDNTNRIAYWYRNVIIDRNINDLQKFFDDLLLEVQYLRDAMEYEVYEKIFNKFPEKRRLLSSVNDLISSIDSRFSEKLEEMLDIFQDEFTNKLEQFFNSAEDSPMEFLELEETVLKCRRKYFDALMAFEKDEYRSG